MDYGPFHEVDFRTQAAKYTDNGALYWSNNMAPGPIENTVLKCLNENYGISGSLERLSGENLNYLLTTPEGERFVVKIVDDDMPAEVSEMEFEASEYALSAGFSLKLPRIVQNIFANNETGIEIRINSQDGLRILTFIDDISLDSFSDISDNLLKMWEFPWLGTIWPCGASIIRPPVEATAGTLLKQGGTGTKS